MMGLGLYTAPPASGGALVLDCAPFASDPVFSSNEHGWERLTCRVNRPAVLAFRLANQYGGLWAVAYDQGTIVWEGRVEDREIVADESGESFTFTAFGAQRALSDVPVTMLFSTTRVSDFQPVQTSQRGDRTPGRYQFQIGADGTVALMPTKGTAYVANATVGSVYYQIPDRSTRQITGTSWDYAVVLPVGWRAAAFGWQAGFSTPVNLWLLVATGALQQGTINLAGGTYDIITFDIFSTANVAAHPNETGDNYLIVSNPRLVTSTLRRVNTSVTAPAAFGPGSATVTVASIANIAVGQRLQINQGAAAGAESVIVTAVAGSTFTATFANAHVSGQSITGHVVTARDILGFTIPVISAINPTHLSSSTALIQSPGLDLTDQVLEDAYLNDVVNTLIGLGDTQTPPRRWEGVIYENRVFAYRPRGSAGRAWYVDASALQVQQTLNDLRNSMYAVYQFPSGGTRRTTTNANAQSVGQYGLTRRAALSTQTTLATLATYLRDTALNDQATPPPRIAVSFPAVYDSGGRRYPLTLVRAGDSLTIRNLPPTYGLPTRVLTFYLARVEYHGGDQTLVVEPEQPLPRLDVQIAQLNAAQ